MAEIKSTRKCKNTLCSTGRGVHSRGWCKVCYERWGYCGDENGVKCPCGTYVHTVLGIASGRAKYCSPECRPRCSVEKCESLANARGYCKKHYSRIVASGKSSSRTCKGCGGSIPEGESAHYCSTACKPRCSVGECEEAARVFGHCTTHAYQVKAFGEVRDRKFTYGNLGDPCVNCGKAWSESFYSWKYCSSGCASRFQRHGGKVVESNCVHCGECIDLSELTPSGRVRKSTTRTCTKCAPRKAHGGDRYSLLLAQSGKCTLCGNLLNLGVKYPHLLAPVMDHIVPLSRGGSNSAENIALVHSACNLWKGSSLVAELDTSVFKARIAPLILDLN